ncbi:hypothetical protein FCV25MIE_34175, partial [Fagus crenata]
MTVIPNFLRPGLAKANVFLCFVQSSLGSPFTCEANEGRRLLPWGPKKILSQYPHGLYVCWKGDPL